MREIPRRSELLKKGSDREVSYSSLKFPYHFYTIAFVVTATILPYLDPVNNVGES